MSACLFQAATTLGTMLGEICSFKAEVKSAIKKKKEEKRGSFPRYDEEEQKRE